MSSENLTAIAEINIYAPVYKVWEALVDPESIKKYMFGSTVESDWKEGSAIVWKGEWNGKPFEDKGKVLKIVPGKTLQYTHESGGQDKGNGHTVTIELSDSNDTTLLTLTQDGNATAEARDEAQKNWTVMLRSLKEMLEEDQ